METQPGLGGVVPYLHYEDAGVMLEWYSRVFGFIERARWTNDAGAITNAEMQVGPTELWLDGRGPGYWQKQGGRPHQWIGVWVDDVDAMYERVRAAGVAADPPVDRAFGVRILTVLDPEGYQWGFMRRIAPVTPSATASSAGRNA